MHLLPIYRKADSSRPGIDIDGFTEDSITGPSGDFVGAGLRVPVDYIEGLATIAVRRPNTGPTIGSVLADTIDYRMVPHDTTEQKQLNVALLSMGVKSEIGAEKTLSEDFMVLGDCQTVSRNGHWRPRLLSYQIPTYRRPALAVWGHRLTDPTPLQATGGWIIIE